MRTIYKGDSEDTLINLNQYQAFVNHRILQAFREGTGFGPLYSLGPALVYSTGGREWKMVRAFRIASLHSSRLSALAFELRSGVGVFSSEVKA